MEPAAFPTELSVTAWFLDVVPTRSPGCQSAGPYASRRCGQSTVALSTVLARTRDMTTLSDALDRLGSFLARALGRTTTIVIGFAMTIVGLGMTATIVLLPLGIVTGLLGVAVFLAGIFAPDRTIDR